MTNLSKLILLLVLTTATLTAQENQNELFVNGSICKNCNLKLRKEELKEIRLSSNSNALVISYKLKIPKLSTINIKGNKIPDKYKQLIQTRTKKGDYISIFDINTNKGKLTSHLVVNLIK